MVPVSGLHFWEAKDTAMYTLASAYPNSALSALTMMVIGLVVAGSLAAWLGLVFLADRAPRERQTTVARLGPEALQSEDTTDNEHSAPQHRAVPEHGAAA
jgi:hypothetical protein